MGWTAGIRRGSGCVLLALSIMATPAAAGEAGPPTGSPVLSAAEAGVTVQEPQLPAALGERQLDAAAAAPSSAAQSFVVDRDRVQCPDAEFQSIQAAVTAAPPGSEIKVCPDRYNEAVTVPKTLRLKAVHGGGRGTGGGNETNPGNRSCFDLTTEPDPARDAIIDGAGTAGMTLAADDIEVEGFVFDNHFFGGIVTLPAFSGYEVRRNRFQRYLNAAISFQTSGAERSRVTGNCFAGQRALGTFSIAIRMEGLTRNASVDHNDFFSHGFVAISLFGVSAVAEDVEIVHNESRGDLRWLVANSTDRAVRVAYNDVSQSGASQILVQFGNRDLEISHNHLERGLNGIDFDTIFIGGPLPPAFLNIGVEVTGNHIEDMIRSGIVAQQGFSANDSLFEGNRLHDNGLDGIRIETGGNAGNTVTRNLLRDNAEHDCHDDTVGPGTAGTANFWIDNSAFTDNRGGQLCPRGRSR